MMKECCKLLQERLDKWTNFDKGHILNCASCGKAAYKQTEATVDLKAENEELKKRPAVKISDGYVYLVFPNVLISIEEICRFGQPGPIVRHQLRQWRDTQLKGEE